MQNLGYSANIKLNNKYRLSKNRYNMGCFDKIDNSTIMIVNAFK